MSGDVPKELRSRWREIVRTSPSGKTQFVCMVCGRVAATPDKECPPFEQWDPSVTGGKRLMRCCSGKAYKEIDDDESERTT